MQELAGKLCKKTGKTCAGQCAGHGKNGQASTCENSVPRRLHIVTDQAQWFKPLSLAELYPLLKQYGSQNYSLVFGNSGFGGYFLIDVITCVGESVYVCVCLCERKKGISICP